MRNIYLGICARKGRGRVIIALIFRTDIPSSQYRVYNNNIERVDLIVGMFAEKRPKGFAFSETAFRIFILMASRRLNSDRFFTTDFTPEIYTSVGMDWIRDNSMSTVVLRFTVVDNSDFSPNA